MSRKKFLVVDDNPDNRFLLSKTLLRKFPDAAVVECASVEAAINLLANERFHVIVTHRTHEFAGADLVREMKKAGPNVPIIAVSGYDRKEDTLAAGASAFQMLDEWLLIGQAVEKLLGSSPSTERAS